MFRIYLVLASLAAFPLLAQEKAPEAPPAAAPGAPGTPGGNQAPGGPLGNFLMPLLLCFVVLWFLWLMPERRKQKARKAMLKNVKKGDTVVTTAGIVGKVQRVEDREVVLQVDKDNDIRMRFLKSAVHEVVPEGGEPGSASAPGGETKP